jgi:hypothetical protein
VNLPVEALAGLAQYREPGQPVSIVVIDIFTAIAARGYVVKTTGNFEA